MNRLILCLAVSITFSTCKSSDTSHTTKDFKIVDATAMQWYGGVQGSGSGIDYSVIVVSNAKKHIQFDSVWIGNRVFIPKLVDMQLKNISALAKSDTASLLFAYRKKGDPDMGDGLVTEFPAERQKPDYSGAGLIMYTIGGESKIKAIGNVRQLEPMFYP